MSWLQVLFSFRGRLTRKPYWIVTIVSYVTVLGLLFLSVVADFQTWAQTTPPTAGTGRLVILIAVLLLTFVVLGGFLFIQIAIAAKRLHDRNKSGWWLLFLIFGGSLFEIASLFEVQG
ncbi:unnamed protein product, partial [marine sediment metagenome]